MAAAYEVTGDQLGTYFDRVHSDADGSSFWHERPSAIFDMCIFDGDFDTMTPGPPGHDTTATRVLVVIDEGLAELVAIARTRSALPTTDPTAYGG